MAKWGEGDPRWIVEERADATNVNNWHWTEKNASGWSKEKVKTLIEGLQIENEEYSCKITEVQMDGEASANNRKAKLIFFYEWDVKLEWTGEVFTSGKTYKGKVAIPNLSDENDADDLDIEVTITSDKDEAYKVKEYMRKEGSPVIREKLAKYIKDLRTEFSQGMILAKDTSDKGKDKENTPNAKAPIQNNAKKQMAQPIVQECGPSVGVKIKCKRLNDKQQFQCRASELYRALTDKEMVMAFTRGGVGQFEAEKGGRFSLFGENVRGEFTDLVMDKKIVMRWRFKTWPDEHFSTVTIDLSQQDSYTELSLTQTGIPEVEWERTRQGWHTYYWQSIKQTFGFGANLF